jgi:hypothetical protein
MYLTPHQKKQLRLVIILLIGIPLTLFAGYKGFQLITKAGVEATPKDVIISNVTTNSMTISWVTEKSTDGYVIPILNGTSQSPVKDKRGSGNRYTHYVELKGLEPDTKYDFQIVSDGTKYSDDQGEDYQFTTAVLSSDTPVPNPIHGTVTGFSSDDVLIYALLTNKTSFPVSTIVPSGGNWIVDLSTFRSITDDSLIRVTDDTQLTLIARTSTTKGVSIEGSYSTIFDSNGKLNPTYTFEIGEQTDLMTYFPTESKLIAKEIEVTPPIVTPDIVIDDTEEETEYDSEEDTVYEIKKDLVWGNLVEDSAGPNLDSGEDTILITNLTDVGFTVAWRSSSKEEGYVKYGESKTDLSEEAQDVRDGLTTKGKYYSHSIELSRLTPETAYYFAVYSGEDVYNNSGQYYLVETFPTLSSPPPFETRSGSLENITDPSDYILIAKLVDEDESGSTGESEYVSTIPDENGNWILTVGDTRTKDGLQYFTFSSADSLKMFIVGNSTKTFDYTATQTNIEIDTILIGSVSTTKISLLEDYGLIIK